MNLAAVFHRFFGRESAGVDGLSWLPLPADVRAAFARATEAGRAQPRAFKDYQKAQREGRPLWRYAVAITDGPTAFSRHFVVVPNAGGMEARRRFAKVRGKAVRRAEKARRRMLRRSA